MDWGIKFMTERKSLNEILNDEQLAKVNEIINLSTNDDDILRRLKKYFLSINNQLEVKGILGDYLAWAVYANCKNLN